MARVAVLVGELRADGHRVNYVDAGGGLGIPYENGAAINFLIMPRAIRKPITRPFPGLNVHVLLEPGRSIVGPAGALVTRVLYRKTNDGKRFVVVDAA